MNRTNLLNAANTIITKDRAATHGKAEDSFYAIAAFWSVYLDKPISSTDVAILMALFKVARLKSNKTHADNWLDLIGYAAIGGEIALAATTSGPFTGELSKEPKPGTWVESKGEDHEYGVPSNIRSAS